MERQRVEKYERRELDVLQGHRREVETLHRRIKDLEEDKRELKNQVQTELRACCTVTRLSPDVLLPSSGTDPPGRQSYP